MGGKIAYIDASGHHGIIAATSDVTDNDWWQGSAINITTTNAIGAGLANTNAINTAYTGPFCGTFTYCFAASECAAQMIGGYDDWYLPSIDELVQVMNNSAVIGGFGDVYYWSSSQYTVANALGVGTSDKVVYQIDKFAVLGVRPVRSF
jgi:hypothetical protein